MKLSSYEQMVKSLAKPGEAILAGLNPQKADLAHHMIGLVGEYLEVEQGRYKGDVENVKEELGDSNFYLTGLSLNVGYKPKIKTDWNSHCVCDILDLVKKCVIYGHELKAEQLFDAMDDFLTYLHSIAESYKLTMEEIIKHNMEKLSKRYKDGYSDAAAQARADKAEAEGSSIVQAAAAG